MEPKEPKYICPNVLSCLLGRRYFNDFSGKLMLREAETAVISQSKDRKDMLECLILNSVNKTRVEGELDRLDCPYLALLNKKSF